MKDYAPRYQLVLQFTATCMADFDELVALENKLIEQLDSFAVVDGHDFGQSEFNIFVLTDDPALAFEKARKAIQEKSDPYNMRVAYRRMDGESYVILWPPGLAEFSIV